MTDSVTPDPHTPGPWRTERRVYCWNIRGPELEAIGRTEEWGKGDMDMRRAMDANARLMAAAPELLAALRLLVECKDIKDRLDGWEAGSTQEMAAMDEWYTENKPKAWEAARAAVAKARGTS